MTKTSPGPGSDHGVVDIAVIGGGINGAGIARDAAGRGLKVLLCEKDDFAEGTSSRSGKLVHGGLRYLEYYEFRLVREALIEREVLLASAPHIIWPMRFVLPHSPEQRPAWLIKTGLFLYDHLGGRKRLPPSRGLDLRLAPEGAPLRPEFRRGFEYSDCWVDDARLVILNLIDASRKGARILPRTRALSARRIDGKWLIEMQGENGSAHLARARALVNAAGPWVQDVVQGVAGLNSAHNVRLVKGSHVVVPKFWTGLHAYLLQNDDRRVIFVNPYEDNLALIGTTDIAYGGRAEDVSIDESEIRYLLGIVRRYFRTAPQDRDIIHAFSGVRPLYDDNAENPSAVTRDYVFEIDGSSERSAVALDLRRQDYHVSQTRRARAGAFSSLASQDAGRLDRRCAASGRGHPGDFRRFRDGSRTRLSHPSAKARLSLRAAVWDARARAFGIGPHLPRSWTPLRRKLL